MDTCHAQQVENMSSRVLCSTRLVQHVSAALERQVLSCRSARCWSL